MERYTRRYGNTRWAVLYGSYEGVERFAVNELQRALQRRLPYVVEIHPASRARQRANEHRIIVGTARGNPLIGRAIAQGTIETPAAPQAYTIAAAAAPAGRPRRVAIAGHDAAGVLYGVEDFCARIPGGDPCENDPRSLEEALEGMGGFAASERPVVRRRGIWTWGYVIYDYRRFIDNMARLRLNMLVIWNDRPPLNSRQVIEYAHSRGIAVVFGFHWGWGLEDIDLGSAADRRRLKRAVLDNYRRNYRGLGIDGIYFQTLTEHSDLAIGRRSVASLVCRFVNDTAGALLEEEPGLLIQFGLHATSIRERFGDLADLDPRVTIVWEDAGTIPYSYNPVSGQSNCEGVRTPEETVEYSRRISALQPGRFAMVAKGWTNLDWTGEFEHHGPFILGERHPLFVKRRAALRRARWDEVNALWRENCEIAARFYRALAAAGAGDMTVLALIEDGAFEAAIEPAAAVFAHTVWNPYLEAAEIAGLAASPYYAS